jgi:hypothetical protein
MGSWAASACTGSFDAAGRSLTKSYSDAATPAVIYAFQYDRVTQVNNSVATIAYSSFDLLDRVLTRTETVSGGSASSATATWRPSGMASETYPSGRTITYGVDAIGRVTDVSGTLNAVLTPYATAGVYAAHGGMSSLAFHNGKTETRTWNYRLQPATIAQGATMSLSYSFCPDTGCGNNNGNLFSQGIGYVVSPRFGSGPCFSEGWAGVCGEDGSSGFIDVGGEARIPFKFCGLGLFHEGLCQSLSHRSRL